MSRPRTISYSRAQARNCATPIVRGLRLQLCALDQQLEAAEDRRQHHLRRAGEHVRLADESLIEFDQLVEQQDGVRRALRNCLAEEGASRG